MNPAPAVSGRSAPLHLLIGLLLGSLLAAPPAAAQTAAPAPAAPGSAAARRATSAAEAISAADKKLLDSLFGRVRPASLRIEQCPPLPQDCSEPDGVGSAVLISAEGLALTAYHVVEGASNLSAVTVDKKRYLLEVVGYDDQQDLALLRVAVPAGTPFLPLARALPAVGDLALAVGNGGGAFLQAKQGRLTALNADAGRADFPPGTLELRAPLVPGDSGGPVLNAQGEVTGIVSYIRLGANGARGLSAYRAYAVPITLADARLAALKAGLKRDAPVIGIGLNQSFDSAFMMNAADFKSLSEVMKLGDTPGAFFTNVTAGSPAARAGLQPLTLNGRYERVSGDLVTEVDGKRIINFSEFQYAVRAHQPGDTVTLTVLRDGKTLKVPVTLVGRSNLRN